jgi:hypothetical protein
MRAYRGGIWISLVLMLLLAAASLAQPVDDALRQEIETLKRGQQDIRNELQEIKRLLQRQQPTRRADPEVSGMVFELGERPLEGVHTAQLTLIEFTDYQ